jgi:two-component system phosphate regulon sensor histidine kinase PhoR
MKTARTKNTFILTLMISSMVLLAVLQFLWLRGAYRSAAETFHRETDLLFRNTILAMHDSLIVRNIEPMKGDSMNGSFKTLRYRGDSSLKGKDGKARFEYFNPVEGEARIEVFINSNGPDTIRHLLRPLIQRVKVNKGVKNFIIKLGPDSLRTDSISINFAHVLKQSDIQANFRVLALNGAADSLLPGRAEKFFSSIVPLNPEHQYAVSFTGIEMLLIRKITPEILFSIFLTLLTLVSFALMYRSVRSQQKLMQQKNDFISNVTHELKTPVATVSVALEALQNFNAMDNAKLSEEYLAIAQRELKRLNEMTDKILKASVLEEAVRITPEPNDLYTITTEVLSNMKMIFQSRNVNVVLEKTGEEFKVHCNKNYLYQLTENLIDNALKYSTDSPQIKVLLTGARNGVTLTVIDNGIGIAEEYHEKIFEKFFRVPTGDIHNIKGYGLGLSFIQNLTTSLGGDIQVSSKPGEGSTFTVFFPKPNFRKIAI